MSSLNCRCPFQGNVWAPLPLLIPGLGSALPGLTLLTPFGLFIPSCPSTTRVAIPQQLFFSGEVKGESAMRSERDVGSKVKYEVTVSILPLCGPSLVFFLLGRG